MTLLLLIGCGDWERSARREANALGRDDMESASADQVVARLAGGNTVSHLLLQPSAAGRMLGPLLQMTAGEADSGTALILLGESDALPPLPASSTAVVTRLDDGWLRRALSHTRPPRESGPADRVGASELNSALNHGWVRASYQPVVSLADRKPIGLEALARLQHPTRGMLAPDLFVPRAESSGLSWKLAASLARRALQEWGGGRLDALDVNLGINLPLAELLRPDLPDWLEHHCAAVGTRHQRLMLEMTETQPVTDLPALRAAAARLRAAGFRLSIDDAGPGARDPEDLLGLGFHAVKVDRVTTAAAAQDPRARAFLDRLVARAHAAGMGVIAEGVEDQEGWRRMQTMGFDSAQGFAIARPLPADAVPVWHQAWQAAGAV